jgi:hypothetical protein
LQLHEEHLTVWLHCFFVTSVQKTRIFCNLLTKKQNELKPLQMCHLSYPPYFHNLKPTKKLKHAKSPVLFDVKHQPGNPISTIICCKRFIIQQPCVQIL